MAEPETAGSEITRLTARTELVAVSVAAMREHQSEYGSFVASPDFGQYQYCWLRDASFVAHALDLAGEHAAAARYHRWVIRALTPLSGVMRDAARLNDTADGRSQLPPARFALDGSVVADDWPNFQIDGYGAWIWSLREHLRLSQDRPLLGEARAVVDATSRYLDALAVRPCFDVWEEHGDQIHTSTLACVHAGLSAAADLLEEGRPAERAAEIRAILLASGSGGWYPKSNKISQVDASTLWLCCPFQVTAAADPAMAATADIVASELDLGGGIRRYPADTYFGGGAWPVLTASLGLYRVAAGDAAAAEQCLSWIEARFDREGRLAEQFGGERRDPQLYREWVERWGYPARDLLWSHAMYAWLAIRASEASPSPGDSAVGLRPSA